MLLFIVNKQYIAIKKNAYNIKYFNRKGKKVSGMRYLEKCIHFENQYMNNGDFSNIISYLNLTIKLIEEPKRYRHSPYLPTIKFMMKEIQKVN